MDTVHDTNFVVYVRTDGRHTGEPGRVERPLAAYATYQEARRMQLAWRRRSRDCVIRYVGVSGGGD
jgi:hypothetical protein